MVLIKIFDKKGERKRERERGGGVERKREKERDAPVIPIHQKIISTES